MASRVTGTEDLTRSVIPAHKKTAARHPYGLAAVYHCGGVVPIKQRDRPFLVNK